MNLKTKNRLFLTVLAIASIFMFFSVIIKTSNMM